MDSAMADGSIGDPVVTYIYKKGSGLKVYKEGNKVYIATESFSTYVAANIQVLSKTYSLQNNNPSCQISFISVGEFNSIKDSLIEATYRTL